MITHDEHKINVLWVVNVSTAEASELFNKKKTPFGGWIQSLSESISTSSLLNITIAFPDDLSKKIQKVKGKKIEYYTFPVVKKVGKEKNMYLKKIVDCVKPDIVHIFGTEYYHSYEMLRICKDSNVEVLLSIQGLVSIIARHYFSSLPLNVIKGLTFRELIKQDNIVKQRKKFEHIGLMEREIIKNIKYVTRRTTFDKACISQINRDAIYYHCGENLRDIFYENKWDFSKCEPHSIFLSQGSYPIKGLHFMLEALAILKSEFIDCKLYISGVDIVSSKSFIDKIKATSYSKYLRGLIEKFSLQDSVIFTGILNEKEMCERYIKSNVFVCSSLIENSPNSLCEAMMLGVPSVATNVGGISDLLEHNKEGYLYHSEAPYMLAYYVSDIFKNTKRAEEFSYNARKKAMLLNGKESNSRTMINIYKDIFEKGKKNI